MMVMKAARRALVSHRRMLSSGTEFPKFVGGMSSEQKEEEATHSSFISVDRSGLYDWEGLGAKEVDDSKVRFVQSKKTGLVDVLNDEIGSRGPISVNRFVKRALGHPRFGYYMKNDVIGEAGDFITAPELNQVFGEMIGIWCVALWTRLGSPRRINIVEAGPGRGTLMQQVLRTAGRFPKFAEALKKVSMVEQSPFLQRVQIDNLGCIGFDKKLLGGGISGHQGAKRRRKGQKLVEQERNAENDMEFIRDKYLAPLGMSPKSMGKRAAKYVEMEWFETIKEAVLGDEPTPTIFIAQEFLDAMPVWQFQYTDHGWREVLVDMERRAPSKTVEGEADDPRPVEEIHHFRFVLARSITPAAQLIMNENLDPKEGDRMEVSFAAGAEVQEMASVLKSMGGGALMIDYGQDGAQASSLRGIKSHENVHPLQEPGDIDLTFNVDFRYLKEAVAQLERTPGAGSNKCSTFGPITQGEFLENMGIKTRVGALLKEKEMESDEMAMMKFYATYQRLCNSKFLDPVTEEIGEGMGKSYKVLGLVSAVPEKYREQLLPDNVRSNEEYEKFVHQDLEGFKPL